MKKAILMTICSLFLMGCTSPAVERERINYPKCNVSEKDSGGGVVVVEIACPGQAPIEKTYFVR